MCAVTQHWVVGETLTAVGGSSGFKSQLRLSNLKQSPFSGRNFQFSFANLVPQHRQERRLGNEVSTSIGKEILMTILGIHSKTLLSLLQKEFLYHVNSLRLALA